MAKGTLTLGGAALVVAAVLSAGPSGDGAVEAGPTTTVPPTAAPTTRAPTTAAAPTTTIAGQPAQRIAPPVSDVKIRPTSLPLRRIGTTLAVAIVVLATCGYVYGKVRSRIPIPAAPARSDGPLPPPPAAAEPVELPPPRADH